MKPSLHDKLIQLSDRLEELNQLLSAEDSTRDMDNYRKLTREHAEIDAVVALFQRYQQVERDIATAKEMLGDPEMKVFAEAELEENQAKLETLELD